MKRYLKELEKELKEYKPEHPLFLYSKKSFEINNYSKKIKESIIKDLISEFGERVLCIEIVGASEIPYEDFEVKKEDKIDFEMRKNVKYRGIIYYGIFEDEIFVNTLYIISEGEEQIPLEVEYDATLENLLAFVSRATEKDIKNVLEFVRKDKASKDKKRQSTKR